MTLERKILGRSGEDIACEYLKSKGFEILERNFRCKFGEIDIIAKSKIPSASRGAGKNQKSKISDLFKKQKEVIVFVEVKAKTGTTWGNPEEMVNKKKQMKIIRSALHWLKIQDTYLNSFFRKEGKKEGIVSWRIDVIAIEYDERGEVKEIRHIENAVVK